MSYKWQRVPPKYAVLALNSSSHTKQSQKLQQHVTPGTVQAAQLAVAMINLPSVAQWALLPCSNPPQQHVSSWHSHVAQLPIAMSGLPSVALN